MLKIRLSKHGKKNAPTFRIEVMESRSKRDGRSVDRLGYFNPQENKFDLNEKKYKKWIKVGAIPTSAVVKLVAGKYKFKKYEPKQKEKEKENAA